MKKEVFNPDEWGGAAREKARLEPSLQGGLAVGREGVADLVEAVEAMAIDITGSYQEWLSVGFALVSELGEEGRGYFHRLSCFYAGYDVQETDRQYSACLKDGSREITVATLFHIAKIHGVRWAGEVFPCGNASSGKRREGSEENEEVGERSPGTFSQSIRGRLPGIMRRIVADAVSDEDADLLILGSLTVFSACIPNVYGVYDRREVFANLFLYVTASASAGKGRLSLCRHLVTPLHRELREQYRKRMEEYKHEQLEFVLNKRKGEVAEPQEPPFLTLFIPANSTATVVYQTLSQNEGVGLLFETEGDTLANAFNSDLGNYSDGFRKAFHHESISYLRKKDHEFVEIVKPKFSAVLSGTPEQIFNLIPSAENGLFSRFIFYVMPTEVVWHDMFEAAEGPTADDVFKEIGRDFYRFHKLLAVQRVRFSLQSDQQRRFNAFFAETQERYAACFGNDIIASVRRLGLIFFRMTMILTVLRQMDEGGLPLPVETMERDCGEVLLLCSEDDFAIAMAMVRVLLRHSVTVFQSLPRKAERRLRQDRRQRTEEARQVFLSSLPVSFNRTTYLQVALQRGIGEKTAERYIAELCRSGWLEHPANGQYVKRE